jgi:hypothetical protein
MLATSGLNVTSVRIGQITGSRTSGAWATTDWVPNFVKSSIALGALPTTNGVSKSSLIVESLFLISLQGGFMASDGRRYGLHRGARDFR